MTAAGGFPWRWIIASLAASVVAVTILVPPPGTREDGTPDPVPEATDPVPGPQPEPVALTVPDTIRVLVLNGTFVDGLAGRTQMKLLRSSSDSTVIMAPFDPLDAEGKPFSETIIVSHLEDLSSAAAVAGILGLPEDRIVWEVPGGGQAPAVDVTVCLGSDLGEDPRFAD
ncbi:MAG: hypothetical protein AVO35_03525 [Candidatus Aegiribacteria sp. MLS_C]|nr:MAG: hypothetical protein AVO35_03525 [Candidatus Aegiribacteria sp. MLS_C]